MQRGGRIRDVSDWSAGRISGRGATRAAQIRSAVDDFDNTPDDGENLDDPNFCGPIEGHIGAELRDQTPSWNYWYCPTCGNDWFEFLDEKD